MSPSCPVPVSATLLSYTLPTGSAEPHTKYARFSCLPTVSLGEHHTHAHSLTYRLDGAGAFLLNLPSVFPTALLGHLWVPGMWQVLSRMFY